MCFGLTSLVTRPSSSLKEKFVVRLESHKDSMDILAIVLRIDVTQGRTVQEVIAIAEEKNGELFLDAWRLIFELLGLSKDFEKLVNANYWSMTDPIKTLENPLLDQYPRDSNHNTHQRSLHEYAQYSNKPEEPLADKFKEPRLKNAEGYGYLHSILDLTHHRMKLASRLQSGLGGTVGETQKTRSSSLNWPEWSLPPPSEDSLSHETWKGTTGTVEVRDDDRKPPPLKENLSLKTWKETVGTVEKRDDDRKPPPSEDNLSHNTWKETTGTVETRKDDRKHHDPEVDKARERKVSDGQDLQHIQNDDSPFSSPATLPVLVVPASQSGQSTANYSRCSTWQVYSDHVLSSGDSKPVTPETENFSLQLVDQDEQNLQEKRRMCLDPHLSPPAHAELKTPESQCQQAVAPDLGEGTDEEDDSGSASEVDTIPSSVYSRTSSTGSSTGSSTRSRPVTPERANIPVGLVTVQQSHLNPMAGQESEVLGETGRPSENDDATENNNDLQQIHPFQLRDIVFLIQSLRERSSELAACQLELQSCRQQCAQQQGDIDELQRILDNSIYLEGENQQLIRMTQELCDMKDQEIGQLAQLCDQKDQDKERLTELCDQKDQANQRLAEEIERLTREHIQRLHHMDQVNEYAQNQIANLGRECQELSENVREVRQSHERQLEAVRERMRLDYERLLDQRTTELAQAFSITETDEIKRLKKELADEKRKRRDLEETNKSLSQPQAMIKKLMSRRGKPVEVPCSAACADSMQEDFGSSSTDSTVTQAYEDNDDQEEDSEDAVDHL